MVRSNELRKIRGEGWLPVLGLLFVLAGSAWLAWNAWGGPASTYALRITGGRRPAPKQKLAMALARESDRLGVLLAITESQGSVESLDEVNDGRVDLALVQGGLDSKRWKDVRQVASLHVEPLQLVVRGELAGQVEGNLRALKGRTINLGEVGSGSEALAREVLGFVGLRPGPAESGGDYLERNLSHQQLLEIKAADQLPEAVLTVSSLPTPVIRHLVTKWGYRLVPLPFGEAFALENLGEGDRPTLVDPSDIRALVETVHLHETHIPAYTYGVEPAVPARPLETFGARILVVANKRVDPSAVKHLLEAIYFTEFAQVARPPLEATLLDLAPEFPLHDGTVGFLQRNKPLLFGDVFEYLQNTSSLVIAVGGGIFVAWQTARRWYRRRRELSFESYLLKVTAIEQQALQFELAAQLDLAALLALQGDLGRLKNEAMERFQEGVLEGEGLMSGFLTHANDARDYLARLILHARTSIEKQARRQGLSPEAAWDLAVGHEGLLGEGTESKPSP